MITEDYTYFLRKAYQAAISSPDPSTQNGAVLIRYNNMLGVGWNDFPPGVNIAHWSGEKEEKYARVVHAEVAAILDAARNGLSTVGTTLVCPWAACSSCAKHIAAAGVTTLVRHSYSNSGVTTGSHWFDECVLGDEILTEAGVTIIEVDPVPTEIKLRRNGNLWQP